MSVPLAVARAQTDAAALGLTALSAADVATAHPHSAGYPAHGTLPSGEHEGFAVHAESAHAQEAGGSGPGVDAGAGRSFRVVLDRSGGQKLGIRVDDSDGAVLVVKTLSPGLVYNWNLGSPSEVWVMPGDRIVEANGCSGDAELLLGECAKQQVLSVRIRSLPGSNTEDMPFVFLSQSPEVFVHVYDLGLARLPLSRLWNGVTTRFGVFHTGVEVYGQEWYFCGGDETSFHGVFAMPEPKRHPHHCYRRTVAMGPAQLSQEALAELIPLLRLKWPRWSYHVSRRNCHHFTNFFCQVLGFPAGPSFGLFGAGDARLAEPPAAPALPPCMACCSCAWRAKSRDLSRAPADAPLMAGAHIEFRDFERLPHATCKGLPKRCADAPAPAPAKP